MQFLALYSMPRCRQGPLHRTSSNEGVTTMQQRINAPAAAPGAYKALVGVENYIRTCGLEPSLIHLVKMRASQINGCAYCLDMHSKDMRKEGETEQRIYLLNAWRESPVY